MEYGCKNINLLDEAKVKHIRKLIYLPRLLMSTLQQLKTTEVKSEKKAETRMIAQRVSTLIHKQADSISQAIEDYAQRQNEREVGHENVRCLVEY